MDKLNWKELEQIPIPEGLEERLEKKIDEWEKSEIKTLSPALPRNGEGDHAESMSLGYKPNGSPHYGGDVRRTKRVFFSLMELITADQFVIEEQQCHDAARDGCIGKVEDGEKNTQC